MEEGKINVVPGCLWRQSGAGKCKGYGGDTLPVEKAGKWLVASFVSLVWEKDMGRFRFCPEEALEFQMWMCKIFQNIYARHCEGKGALQVSQAWGTASKVTQSFLKQLPFSFLIPLVQGHTEET